MGNGYSPLVAGLNRFGLRLQGELAAASPGENLVLSPASIGLAMAMLRLGARGTTRQLMDRGLGFSGYATDRDFAAGIEELLAQLAAESGQRTIAIANSLWASLGRLEFHPEFQELCRRYLGAEAAAVDLKRMAGIEQVNGWIEEHTAGRVKNLLGEKSLNSVALLVNALFFKGSWVRPFESSSTAHLPFTREDGQRKNVATLRGTVGLRSWNRQGRQWLSLPFRGDAEMLAMLPRPGQQLAAAVAGLELEDLEEPEGSVERRAGLELPRLAIELKSDLLAILGAQNLGLGAQEGDFSGLAAGPLVLTGAIHQARVEIDEEGALGVAATFMALSRGMAEPPENPLKLDRPFFFLLREKKTGLILFSGLVYDPGEG